MTWGVGVRPWAGLDIGSYSVKLVSMLPGGARARCAEAVVPRLSGDEPPGPALIAGLIDDCMSRVDQSPRAFRGLSIGVSGADVVVKQLLLPYMDEHEVSGALRFEAKKHLPFDLQSMVLDHQVLARNSGERRLDVLFAAVSQARLDRALAPLRELGVEADIVDAAPLALSNAFAQANSRESGLEHEPRLLLDLGHRGSWLTLRHKGQPYFARRLDWGGAHVTQSVAAVHGGLLDRADAWKLDPSSSVDQPGPEAAATRRALERLADEVRRSLAYYGTMAKVPAALTLHVCGGTARLAGLPERLGSLLEMPVSVFSPLEGVERGVSSLTTGPQFTQAYGLAMRAA